MWTEIGGGSVRISAALIAKKTGKPPRETDCPPSMLLLTPLLLSTGLVVPHQASTASVARVTSARMGMAGAATVDGVRVGPPPDLPSLLLHNRIVYCGMALVPSVTELVVAELLYLNYENPTKNIYFYINSPGTLGAGGMALETEAFAVCDTMNYVSPEIETICLGTAFGTAAMLLSSGEKGKRSCLPNASIMLHQPRSGVRGQASDIKIKAREVLTARETINTIFSQTTGQSVERITADSSRTKYLDPGQAKAFGIIDKVLVSADDLPQKPTFLASL